MQFIESLLKRHNLPHKAGSTADQIMRHAVDVDISRKPDFLTILDRMRTPEIDRLSSGSEAPDCEEDSVSRFIDEWFGPVTAQGLEERSADVEEIGEAICTLMLSGLLVDDSDWRKAFENRKPGEFPSVRIEMTPEIRDEHAAWFLRVFGNETAWRNQRLFKAASDVVGSMTVEHLRDELINQLAPELVEVEA